VVVLSYDYWRSRWNSDPDVVGRRIRINHRPVEVVGVTPVRFEGLMTRGSVIWMPIRLRATLLTGSGAPQQDFSRFSIAVYGKLKPGISRAAGEGELTSLTRELARQQPSAFREDEVIHANLVQESIVRRIQQFPAVGIMMIIILLVLLSACANLGNLLLARGL